MGNINLEQIGAAIVLLATLIGGLSGLYKLIEAFNKMNKHLVENYDAILRITFMMEEMPMSERLKAGHSYVERGGNGAVRARYQILEQEYKKEHSLKSEKEFLEFIEEVHD